MNKFFGGVLVVGLASCAWAAPQARATAASPTGQPAIKHGATKSAVKHTKSHGRKHNAIHGNTVQAVK